MTQLAWGWVFGDSVRGDNHTSACISQLAPGSKGFATAILDRLLRSGDIITIQGRSYSLREKRGAGIVPVVRS